MAAKRKRRRRKSYGRIIVLALLVVAVLVLLALIIFGSNKPESGEEEKPGLIGSIFSSPTPEPTPVPTPEPTPTPIPEPAAGAGTQPSDFGLESEMQLDGAEISTYNAPADLSFGELGDYGAGIEGVITFRGNNFRDDPTYGTAGAVAERKLELVWEKPIPGSIKKGDSDGAWFGAGWTGQPLVVKWPEATKRIMNLYDGPKANSDLVEVIYATESSYIYFMDLATGEYTRDKISGGWTFKGSGSLDPRGYPLLYVGAGDSSENGGATNMIFSLIDGERLYSYGQDDEFSLRNFKAFDGATLIHAGSDTVTYASESGIIYQFKLNTVYDEAAGTVSVDPSNILKWRYTTERSRENGTKAYWLGFESSPIIWRNYLYASDNGGNLFCIDINTMQVKWMQDVLDDTNCTPVFELDEENMTAYIYMGTSLHWTADDNETGNIPFWKINAITGEIIWTADTKRVSRQSNVSGGIQDTAALGKNNLSDLVFVNYAKLVDEETRGALVAYYKDSGEAAWTKYLHAYSWSSPAVVYDDNGDGYIVTFDSAGYCYLFDGRTGETLDKLELEGNFEASPAVYNDMVVIGSRGGSAYGIRVK